MFDLDFGGRNCFVKGTIRDRECQSILMLYLNIVLYERILESDIYDPVSRTHTHDDT